jgi:hypothetical protein
MAHFLYWFEISKHQESRLDPVLRAANADFWFVTVHPLEDGNGRIARAIADMALAHADTTSQYFYGMSAQIESERKEYYLALELQTCYRSTPIQSVPGVAPRAGMRTPPWGKEMPTGGRAYQPRVKPWIPIPEGGDGMSARFPMS